MTLRLADPVDGSVEDDVAPHPRWSVLSVEDVASNQLLLTLFLDPERYDVDPVQTGREALSAVAARRYDLVLLDLRLPDIDGLDVVRDIRAAERARGETRPLAIVAVTADVLPATIAQARAAGVDEHLAKPFTSAMLRAAVARRLEAPAPTTLEGLNEVVADLAREHGAAAVARLLEMLSGHLGRLDVTTANPTELARTAHAIKGAAANLGFTTVAHACLELESACQSGASLAPVLPTAIAACGRARRDIAAFLRVAA